MPNKNERVLYTRTTKALHRQARARATAEDLTLGRLVEKAVSFYLSVKEGSELDGQVRSKVKVRIAVAVDEEGLWAVAGDAWNEGLAQEEAVQALGTDSGPINVVWVTAELLIPEPAEVEGTIEEANQMAEEWLPAIPEPLWVGPLELVARCECGKRFLRRDRYRLHWIRTHGADRLLDPHWPRTRLDRLVPKGFREGEAG